MIPQMGYDRAITVFSPDGRLFQVEYAREAVKRGTTAIGIKASDGVVLLADKRIASKLLEVRSLEKIFLIDEHIGAVTSGLVADARVLIDKGRLEAQINRIIYDEPIDVATLAKKICDFKQIYTQIGGLRPFGTALLLAGVYEGECYLFETDPSGALLEYKATAIGAGRNSVIEALESEYDMQMTCDDAIHLGLKALFRVSEGGASAMNVDIGIADLSKEKFRILSNEEVERYVERVRREQQDSERSE
ncbi:MAG: archaeal proteasome endopeptidase complex subunit alpha [Canidatus Methanoxibalbensis ujae]|nr:archaeal proteasome endopeptidase complex subunit alpha [Candidatus Methanoxibalbensis ujae]MCW7078292.1 archaeal proteasome endopeptidase complex subunit alpha [Candidatus Methanoxibalbensis ujae]